MGPAVSADFESWGGLCDSQIDEDCRVNNGLDAVGCAIFRQRDRNIIRIKRVFLIVESRVRQRLRGPQDFPIGIEDLRAKLDSDMQISALIISAKIKLALHVKSNKQICPLTQHSSK